MFTDLKPMYNYIFGENLNTLKTLIGTNFDVLEKLKFNAKSRQMILEFLISYYELHLPGFKRPKSLSVLKDRDKERKNIILFFIVLFGHFSFAQNCIVFDKDSQFPISNVSISNEDNSLRVISDKNGMIDLSHFSMMDILTIRHVSYVELELLKKQIIDNDKKIFLLNKYKSININLYKCFREYQSISIDTL